MANMVDLLNTILEHASDDYRSRVPQATQTNIEEVGTAITTYTPATNEFITTLLNKIAISSVIAKRFNNPLELFRKGKMPLGSDIEEIFIEMAEDQSFDPNGADLMSRKKPTSYVCYHKVKRKSKYKISVSEDQIQEAFTSYEKLEEFVKKQMNTLYSGDSFDEFYLMKKCLSSIVQKGFVPQVVVSAPSSKENAKALLKAIRKTSKLMKFPSTDLNGFNLINENASIKTWVEDENKVLVVTSDIMEDLNVEALAEIFNVDKAKIQDRIVEIDNFLYDENDTNRIYCMICDSALLEVRDMLFKVTSFQNASGLFTNYFLHHWQQYKVSLFADCVAFVSSAYELQEINNTENVTGHTSTGNITEQTS